VSRLRAREREKTAWRVVCPEHGPVFLTQREYQRQMSAFNSEWTCPAWEDGDPTDPRAAGPGICGQLCRWDDSWHEMWMGDAQGPEAE